MIRAKDRQKEVCYKIIKDMNSDDEHESSDIII